MVVYHWDGQNLVRESNGEGGTKATYLRGAGLVAQVIDCTLFYYLLNAHGDVIQRIAGNKQAAPRYEYDAFGVQRERVGYSEAKDPNPLRYCGEYWDSDTQELYLRARTYQPKNGRFTSEDPAKDGGNWYGYCGGEPVGRTDPSGLKSYPFGMTKEQWERHSAAQNAAYAWAAAQTKATALSHSKNTSQNAAYAWAAAQTEATALLSEVRQTYSHSPAAQHYQSPGTTARLLPDTEWWSISRFIKDDHNGTDLYTNNVRNRGNDAGNNGKGSPTGTEWGGVVVAIQTGMPDEGGEARGNYVIVKLNSSYGTDRYMIFQHLDAVLVEEGQWLSEDTLVGTVGESGVSGIHLHIELREGVVNNNPNTGTVLSLENTTMPNGELLFDWKWRYDVNDQ